MRKGLLASAILLFGSAAWAAEPAEESMAPTAPAPTVGVQSSACIACPPTVCPEACDPACPERLWMSADYLLWFLKSQPAPGPLVTRGSAADPVPGALGQPNTVVLFGNQNINENPYSGMRFGAGYWFGQERRIGIEGSFFLLEKQTQFFSAASGPAGTPVIARPLTFAPAGVQGSEASSFPGELAGGTAVAASSRLLGWETNVAYRVARQGNFTWDVLAGFRSLDLNESLVMHDHLTPILPDGFLTFLGVANGVNPPSTMSDFDSFHTSNKFYGGQIGSRFDWRSGRFHANVLTKLALGTTQELVTISGSTSVFTPGAATVTALGGILAQPTNIGTYFRNEFGVVPEVGLNFGYQVTPHIEVLVGYSFLYWNSVVRPGNTIDHTVNASQIPSDQSFTPGAAVPPRPGFGFNSSDFWAQGINFGLAFRY
jgi:hypothetical protein